MPKNLVTGASGFLGSHVVAALAERGEMVRALVRPSSKVDQLKGVGVELAYGDLNDSRSLETAAQGIDRIYHCAALVGDWGKKEAFYSANVTGVGNLLEAAVKARVSKFIHVSTTDVYGHPDYPAEETAPYKLRGWYYGDTKIKGEQLVWSYYHQRGLPITVVRPASIYGPRSISLVRDFVEQLKSGNMALVGKGEKNAGLAYVANVVDLLLLTADNGTSVGQAYNATDGSDITWRQYIDRLAQISGTASPRLMIPYRLAYLAGWTMEKVFFTLQKKTRPLVTRMIVELLGTNQGFPNDKARTQLGYEPKVSFDEGMHQVDLWLRQTGSI